MSIDKVTFRRATLLDVGAIHVLVQLAYRGDAAASWSHEGEIPTGERISCAALTGLGALLPVRFVPREWPVMA